MTPLLHETDKLQNTPKFYLIQVLSTLCVESLTHFLVYDCHIKQARLWQTIDVGYRSDIHLEVDIQMQTLILEKREHYLRVHGMIYNPEKGYLRDTHKPENAKRDKEIKNWTAEQVKKAEDKWRMLLGPPQTLINLIDSTNDKRKRSLRTPKVKHVVDIVVEQKTKKQATKPRSKLNETFDDYLISSNEKDALQLLHLNKKFESLENKVSAAVTSIVSKATNKESLSAYSRNDSDRLFDSLINRDRDLSKKEELYFKENKELMKDTFDKLIQSSSHQFDKITSACSSDRTWLTIKEDNARLERENMAQRAHIERMRELELQSQERSAQEREVQRTEREKAVILSSRSSCNLM